MRKISLLGLVVSLCLSLVILMFKEGLAVQLSQEPEYGSPSQTDWSVKGRHAGSLGDINGDGFDDVSIDSYVFLGGANGLSSSPHLTVTELAWDATPVGLTLSSAGDVNGDGFEDLLVAAPEHDNGRGAVKLLLGTLQGVGPESSWDLVGSEEGEWLGAELASIGDVDNDGYDDFAVGAPGRQNADSLGKILIFRGAADGPAANADRVLSGTKDEKRFGVLIAAAGDVDGDSYGDFLVATDLGRQIMLYYGGLEGVTRPSVTLDPAPDRPQSQRTFHGIGDANGDGYDDVATVMKMGENQFGIHLYLGSEKGLISTPDGYTLPVTSGAAYAVLRGVGDVDNDGYADVAIGLAGFRPSERGKVKLWFGSADGFDEDRSRELLAPIVADGFGAGVAGAGDVDGDGFGDLLVSAQMASDEFDPFVRLGKVSLYYGSTDGPAPKRFFWSADLPQVLSLDPPGEIAGWPATIGGDVNGDGYDDLVVNSSGNPDMYMPGRILVYMGFESGVHNRPGWQATANAWGGQNGSDGVWISLAISPVGDLNADGYDDLAQAIRNFRTGDGRILVYWGGADGPDASPSVLEAPKQEEFWFGIRLAGVGDVNGDSYDDLAALSFDDETWRAVVSVYHGDAQGIATEPHWVIEDVERVADFGAGLSRLGDLNNDGYDDLLIGSPGSPDGDDAGQVRIYLGGRGGLSQEPAWMEDGDSPGIPLGTNVAGLGDVNGDGNLDFAAVWPADSDGISRVVVYLTDETGLSDLRRQELDIVGDTDFFGSLDAKHVVSAFVGGLGDLNGDGFDDMLVGSHMPTSADGHNDWQIFLGGPDGIAATPALETIRPMGDLGRLLLQVVSPGDLNGDGYTDFALGMADFEAFAEGDETTPGEVSIYYGGPAGAISPLWSGAARWHVRPAEIIAPLSVAKQARDLSVGAPLQLAMEGVKAQYQLTPDGRKLLFETESGRLCVWELETSEQQSCVAAEDIPVGARPETMVWSRTGHYMVFTEDVVEYSNEGDVWLWDVISGELINLTDDGVTGHLSDSSVSGDQIDYMPVWSPDDNMILFVRARRDDPGTDLFVIDLSDSAAHQLVNVSPSIALVVPYWTDDGAAIIYTYFGDGSDDERNGVWILRQESQRLEQLLPLHPIKGPPVVVDVTSSDGRVLVVYPELLLGQSNVNDLSPFVVFDLGTKEVSELIPTSSESSIAGPHNAVFSPDGSKILFTYSDANGNHLAVRDGDGATEAVLMSTQELWGGQAEGPGELSWSHNDTVFMTTATYDQAMLLEIR